MGGYVAPLALSGHSRLAKGTKIPVLRSSASPLKTLGPPLGVPESDGNASGYHGRDRWLCPLRWEWGGCHQ
jgi:hypothetical protein